MYQVMVTARWGSSVEFRVYADEHTEGNDRIEHLWYEESLQTPEGVAGPDCPLSALSAIGMFLARAEHVIDGVS